MTSYGRLFRAMSGASLAGPCVLAAALSGCGGGDVGPLVPVAGTVKIDGAPAPGVSVTFVAEPGTPGSGGSGTTDGSGAFVVSHRTGAPGLAAGTYKVVFSKYVLPDGSPLPTIPGTSAATLGARQLLPPEQSDLARSRQVVTVAESSRPLDFELKTKSRKRRG